MAKRLILLVLLVFGSILILNLNETRATGKDDPASGSGTRAEKSSHRAVPPYRIISSRYVSRSTIKRSADSNNGVRIRLMQNGVDNVKIEDFSLAYDSGSQYNMMNLYCIDNSSLPLYVKVTYRSWNTFHAVQMDVIYEVVIYYPGTWDITIWN